MTDITKCTGKGCPIKRICYRYQADEGFRQSYVATPPWDKKNKTCEMFWRYQPSD